MVQNLPKIEWCDCIFDFTHLYSIKMRKNKKDHTGQSETI